MRRFVIIGGTSAIAEHCARLWVQAEPIDLTLVVRDPVKGERIAADLRVRSPGSRLSVVEGEFEDAGAIAEQVNQIGAQGAVDTVLIAHGVLPDQHACQENVALCASALYLNGISPVLFAEAFVSHMLRAGTGTVAIIGSVAGDRGRKSNYVYGAAKGLLDRYAQGLQHRLANTAVDVILIKPGPTQTPMTATMGGKAGKLAPVQDVAADIVKGIARSRPVIYTPGKWAIIMMVIRNLPRFIFNKMDI